MCIRDRGGRQRDPAALGVQPDVVVPGQLGPERLPGGGEEQPAAGRGGRHRHGGAVLPQRPGHQSAKVRAHLDRVDDQAGGHQEAVWLAGPPGRDLFGLGVQPVLPVRVHRDRAVLLRAAPARPLRARRIGAWQHGPTAPGVANGLRPEFNAEGPAPAIRPLHLGSPPRLWEHHAVPASDLTTQQRFEVTPLSTTGRYETANETGHDGPAEPSSNRRPDWVTHSRE